MDKADNYLSDGDESDEDFCPENEAEVEDSAQSVEEESGVDEDQVEDNSDNSDIKERIKTKCTKADTAKTRKKKIKKIIKKNAKNEISEKRPHTRQTDDICESKGKSPSEKVTLESDEDDKTRTDALWADFLNDVKPTSKQENEEATNITSSSINVKGKPVDMTEQQSKIKTIQENKTESKDKLIVTEVMDFAGEDIRIQKQIDLNSSSSKKENRAALTATPKMQPFGRIMPGAGLKRQSPSLSGSSSSGSGLGTILNQIGKKKKLSVLEKTKLDWNSFKHDEGIAEELQTFNKGKDGYLERQDFLQRTDLRQFEIEKSLRHSRRNH
uniref:Craniofacial development protein 1 n=1 Tax=Glossina morsitans morsitans TaxID=37546 RepID=A0A1B0GEY5_GLOMM